MEWNRSNTVISIEFNTPGCRNTIGATLTADATYKIYTEVVLPAMNSHTPKGYKRLVFTLLKALADNADSVIVTDDVED